jgi:hypothetical protein
LLATYGIILIYILFQTPLQTAKAKATIKENKFSIESWLILIKNAQESNINESREFYEELIQEFSTCGRFWKIYIEQEVSSFFCKKTFLNLIILD